MPLTLTDSESKVLAAAWQCFETAPKINADKLAELLGAKNKESARAMYNTARRKIMGGSDGPGSAPSTPTKVRKTTAKVQRTAGNTPKKRSGKQRSGKAYDNDEDEEMHGEEDDHHSNPDSDEKEMKGFGTSEAADEEAMGHVNAEMDHVKEEAE